MWASKAFLFQGHTGLWRMARTARRWRSLQLEAKIELVRIGFHEAEQALPFCL